MNEEFLHYIWKYALYNSSGLVTECGKKVRVVNPGRHNRDAGPDFLEARLNIDDILWVGHVEIHINSADWEKHGHQNDPAYDPVILHVVGKAGKQVKNSQNQPVLTAELKISREIFDNYKELLTELKPVPCAGKWQELSPVKVENAIVAMGVERMESRMNQLKDLYRDNRGGWKEVFLQSVCRGFGFGKNQESMELLGKSVNPGWVEKHYANLFQLESIFFGQAGFIPEKHPDPYLSALRTEYNYLSRKYNMNAPQGLRWKYLRMRPGNFPAVRIAQMCSFLLENQNLVEYIIEIATSLDPGRIQIVTSSYWRSHYDIDKISAVQLPGMGDNSRQLLMINVFLPLNAFFRFRKGENDAVEFWQDQLENLPAEENRVIRLWQDIGFRVPNAFYSQSFFYMYRNYCAGKRCLACRLGQLILAGDRQAW